MSPNNPTLGIVLALPFICAINQPLRADTINATSCSQSDVQSAINSASSGDTVAVPSGSCTWSRLTINKAVHVRGAGPDSTTIRKGGNNTITRQSDGVVRLSGFTFTASGGNGYMFTVSGETNDRPALIGDNRINANNSSVFRFGSNGVVFYDNTITCTSGDESVVKPVVGGLSTLDWNTPHTMGVADSDGERNIYVEDNTINNCWNQWIDFDDNARGVFRYNTLNESSFNTHGFATSAVGVRHFEVYKNDFRFEKVVNINWFIWIRGGTGVVYDNQIDNIESGMWGDKNEVRLSVRSASDGGGQYPGGCCRTWPCIRQLGQGHNGSSQIDDPIYFWDNNGSFSIVADQGWGNCGGPASEFIQRGRDYITDGTERPGYAPYPYPHPLRGTVVRPQEPQDLRIE